MTQSMKRNPKRKKNISKTTRKYENINNHKLIEKNIFPNAYSDSILFYALCSTHLNTNDDDTQQRLLTKKTKVLTLFFRLCPLFKLLSCNRFLFHRIQIYVYVYIFSRLFFAPFPTINKHKRWLEYVAIRKRIRNI